MLKEICAEPRKAVVSEPAKNIRVCFVCSGNTCRSPMAEAVLSFLGKGKYTACSAGLFATEGEIINEKSVMALEKAKILPTDACDFHEHRAALFDEIFCEGCDRIITMTQPQLSWLCERFPQYRDKFSKMSREIPDPFMCSQETYDLCLEQIVYCIKEMFSL